MYSRKMGTSSVETGVEWIGFNPDPSRYHLELLERRKRHREDLRITSSGLEEIKPDLSKEIYRREHSTSSQEYGRWLGRIRARRSLSHIEISGPSARGTIAREFYRSNINSCLSVL